MSKGSKIIIGTAARKNVGFDLDVLLPTRLLITADSGGGKSWLIRALCEQLFGKVQTIIIDPEGEFATLREKFAYVLVGKGGETPADVRSAGLLAVRLLELRASAVCDISEMKPLERHIWVRDFCEGLIEAPKKLRTPCVVVVDEIQTFGPENGEGESVAKSAMIDLSTKGRKRFLCLVGATQRLAQLDKSISSMLLNRLVGPTFEDVNLKRAARVLSIGKGKEEAAFFSEIKLLEPGYFYALGRAICKERTLVKIRDVVTSHPKAFERHVAPPPPAPGKIKALLPKLADLPKEAEDKARTEADFRREIRELKTKLTQAEKTQPVTVPGALQKVAARVEEISRLRIALKEAMKLMAKLSSMEIQVASVDHADIEAAVRAAVDRIVGLTARACTEKQKQVDQMRREAKPVLDRLQQILAVQDPPVFAVVPPAPANNKPAPTRKAKTAPVHGPIIIDGEFKVRSIHRKIVGTLAAYYPDSVKRSIIAALCGRVDGGGFGNDISECRTAGLLENAAPGELRATEKGAREFAGLFHAPTTTAEMLEIWIPKLSKTPAAVLRYLVENPDPIPRADLAAAVGRIDGGGFSNDLSELRVAGLLVDPAKGQVAANKKALFLDGDAG